MLLTGNRKNVAVILVFNFRVAGSIYASEDERITLPSNVRGKTQAPYVTIQVIYSLKISIQFKCSLNVKYYLHFDAPISIIIFLSSQPTNNKESLN